MNSTQNMTDRAGRLSAILDAQPVMPVLVIEDIRSAVPLARALVAGGLSGIEITLRTSAALDAIRAVKDEVDGVKVGAGTVLTGGQWDKAVAAGAEFIVTPGATSNLLSAARNSQVPLLPGASTVSEIMFLRDEGYNVVKFFPAEQSGGAAYLKALASPLADIHFCPTGGISLRNAADYLSLPNVICIGGSWLAPADLVAVRDWAGVTNLARETRHSLGQRHHPH